VSQLWTPERVMPTERHKDGGSFFDDETDSTADKEKEIFADLERLMDHINKRPDHTVYVGSMESRGQLREVFNWWFQQGVITHHPNIRIEYGVVEGSIRVAE
jgi:hypothetical protein